ncbi:hypothetical protein [Arthrobacter cryoconiti]|uniref:DUF4190 domain-containing protein n=1 Tax=Arthrobacter cryoconiti TaxID=748907 RepID=UPI0031E9D3E2
MSNQPDQPQPQPDIPAGYTPPGYLPQTVDQVRAQEPQLPQPNQEQQVPQAPQYGQEQQVPQAPQYGQEQQVPQAPQYGQEQQVPQAPQYGQEQQAPQYGQQPQTQPQYGQSPYGKVPYGQNPYGAPQGGQFQQPQFAAPTYYQGGPGYVDATSGPRGLSLASMIIGLTSLFVAGWFIIPQIVGIVLGHMGVAKESPQGKPFSITGLITNYLALVIYGGLYAFFIFGLAIMANDSGSYSSGYSSMLPGL